MKIYDKHENKFTFSITSQLLTDKTFILFLKNFFSNGYGRTNGSAYIFVLVISAGIFIMLSTTLKTTRLIADVSHAYTNNANLYYLAESGVFKALKVMDEALLLVEFEESEDESQKLITANNALRGYMKMGHSDEYHELLTYQIETLHKEGIPMTFNITVYIKAPLGVTSYTILSIAENGEAAVSVIGHADTEYIPGERVISKLSSLRQLN